MDGSEDAEAVETTQNNTDSRMLFVERGVVIFPKGRSRNAKSRKNHFASTSHDRTGNDIFYSKGLTSRERL